MGAYRDQVAEISRLASFFYVSIYAFLKIWMILNFEFDFLIHV
jgi:hypothetical protein